MYMDWYEIEYLYPKAFERFKDVMFPHTGLVSLTTLEFFDMKKLYYFFDKEHIYLIVEFFKPDQWIYTITTNEIVLGPGEFQNTREKCEINGFNDCFKILDKKLTD